MGSLVGSVFSLLFGWMRGIASGVWQFLSGTSGGSPLQWLAGNWLTLALILCAAGTAADILVHLLRWQPHKVWASFFRRMAHRNDPVPDETEAPDTAYEPAYAPAPVPPVPEAAPQHTWIYADGTEVPGSTAEPAEESVPEQTWQAPPQSDVPAWLTRDAGAAVPARPAETDNTKRLPELREAPPVPQPALQAVPAEAAAETGEPSGQGSVTERLRKRMAAIPKQFGLSEEDDPYIIRYEPPKLSVNRDEAYRTPVQPARREPAADGRKHRRRAGTRKETGS